MKKLSLLMILLSMCVFISCKKTYTCECTITQTFPPEFDEEPSVSVLTTDFEAKNQTKAEEECETEVFQTIGGMTQSTVCRLK